MPPILNTSHYTFYGTPMLKIIPLTGLLDKYIPYSGILARTQFSLFTMEMIVSSCIQGYHVYGEGRHLWGNSCFANESPEMWLIRWYAMAKKDSGVTIGHLPRKI